MEYMIPQEDLKSLMDMPKAEVSKTASQMMALLTAMSEEKQNIDSLTTMLEKQPWYKRCLFTVIGKNKATVNEISKHKDKLAAYTSLALAQMYENQRIEQNQIVALGEAVNYVNGQLAATNYELMKTQAAVAELKTSLINSMTALAKNLDEKITSVDNYHMLVEDIEDGIYDDENIIAEMFSVLAMIDKRTAEDDRKMNRIRKRLTDKGFLNDNEISITDYMRIASAVPEDKLGVVYYELFSLPQNMYSEIFVELMENYNFLPKMEKKAKKVDTIIGSIIEKNQIETETNFSTNELYDFFSENKKEYLSGIREIKFTEGTITSEGDNLNSDIPDIFISLINNPKISTCDIIKVLLNKSTVFNDNIYNNIKKQAENGVVGAQLFIALCYDENSKISLNNDFIESNNQIAAEWYCKAAEQGNASAQYGIGFLYRRGLGVTKDYEKAVNWFKASALLGETNAQYELGFCYAHGYGTRKNYTEAIKWYIKSAESGHSEAQYELGECYDMGVGVQQDYSKAIEYYSKSAESGNTEAQYALGLLYQSFYEYPDMYEIKADKKDAIKWFKKAYDGGHEFAEEKLNELGVFI